MQESKLQGGAAAGKGGERRGGERTAAANDGTLAHGRWKQDAITLAQ